jgi:hypothetical protein
MINSSDDIRLLGWLATLGSARARREGGRSHYRGAAMTTGHSDLLTVNRHLFRGGWFFTDDLYEFDAEGRRCNTRRKRLIVEVAGHNVDSREVEAVLLDHCEARLTPLKCPSVIKFGERLLRTVLGKVRGGALLARERAQPAARPVADREQLFVEQVIRPVGQRDPAIELSVPLMEYGLTSTHWVEVADRIQARLGRAIRTTVLWNYQTIGAMARQLTRSDAALGVAEITELSHEAVRDPPSRFRRSSRAEISLQ